MSVWAWVCTHTHSFVSACCTVRTPAGDALASAGDDKVWISFVSLALRCLQGWQVRLLLFFSVAVLTCETATNEAYFHYKSSLLLLQMKPISATNDAYFHYKSSLLLLQMKPMLLQMKPISATNDAYFYYAQMARTSYKKQNPLSLSLWHLFRAPR